MPEWFHFHYFLYESHVKTTNVSFSTNILATRDSSFTMYTYNRYLTRNLEKSIYDLTSPNLQLSDSNASISNSLFCLISPEFFYILSVTDGWHLQLNSQSLQKSILVSVLGNFLVNLKCLYLLWKFLINQ